MKKAYFISVLIAGIVTVGLSESPEATISKDKDMPGSAVNNGQTSRLGKAKEDVKRTWADMPRKSGGESRDASPEERYEGACRGTGCYALHGSGLIPLQGQNDQTPSASPESEYLKEIAAVLSIPVSTDDTPGDIAFKIKQCIGTTECYRGHVLSDESFEKARSAIRIPSDAETFVEYHKFIRNIAGKRIIVVGDDGQR